jgi:hypothetical protein
MGTELPRPMTTPEKEQQKQNALVREAAKQRARNAEGECVNKMKADYSQDQGRKHLSTSAAKVHCPR